MIREGKGGDGKKLMRKEGKRTTEENKVAGRKERKGMNL